MTTATPTPPTKNDKNVVDWNGLRLTTRPNVYEPREDSFLLAQTAQEHARGLVLDLGCGSGIAGIAAAKNPSMAQVVSADVSIEAIELAKANAQANGTLAKTIFVRSNLFSALPQRFDTILFNPPYLPREKESQTKIAPPLRNALEGGETGRAVLDRFLSQAKAHLTPNGQLFLISSSLSSSKSDGSGNKETLEKLAREGFEGKILAQQRFFFEELVVIAARRA